MPNCAIVLYFVRSRKRTVTEHMSSILTYLSKLHNFEGYAVMRYIKNLYLFSSSRANRTVQAFMDIVGGPFNHLVPSDQLDDSLLLGQNLECEASDEFETGHGHPEDSLKNMLSDKDPMFGSASAQFHLLENEDVNFKLGSSSGTVVAFEVCLWFNLE